jgi:hypothetical protein
MSDLQDFAEHLISPTLSTISGVWMVWNSFSSGSATEIVIVSGLAPGSTALTLIVGVS